MVCCIPLMRSNFFRHHFVLKLENQNIKCFLRYSAEALSGRRAYLRALTPGNTATPRNVAAMATLCTV